jgi:parallel beta-helix repeat protein
MYNNVSYNNATENRQGGITLRCLHSSFNNVSYNNATGNDIWGIYIGGYNNSVYNNTANETGYGTIAQDDEGVGICLCRSMSDNNSIRNNTVCWNEGHGIRIIQDATGNTLYDNIVCFNGQVTGVDIKDLDDTTGDNNTCSTTHNFDDDGTTGCTFPCPCVGPNLVVTDKTEKWFVNYENYTINYTIGNTGKSVSNISWTSIYINGTLAGVDGPIDPINPGACADERTVGPFDSYGPDDTIRLWADWNGSIGNTTECREADNNRTNVFGGADLVIEDFDHTWTDLSWKTYDVTYTVRNIGDRPTPVSCEVNFTDITIGGGDWKGCVDPAIIPAGLGIGETVGLRTRTFVMGDTNDWVEVWVNFNHTCPVKVWNVLQHDRDRRHATYMGPCKECGDADCSGVVNTLDAQQAWGGADACTCAWAADVNCDIGGGVVNTLDAQMIWQDSPRNCCEGCERW